MNTDIRLLVSFKGHRKREKLKMVLGPEADGLLIDLWLTAAEDRPDGILTGWDETDIALAAGWNDKPSKLIDAMKKCGWLDVLEDETFKLHNWEKYQGWACGAKARSEAARKAARIRWDKRFGSLSEKPKECEGNAPALRPHKNGNTPSPSPIPSPNPNPSPIPKHAPDFPVKKSPAGDHFKFKVGDYLDVILSEIELINKFKQNGKPLNKKILYQWIQEKANSNGHPKAIFKSLNWLREMLENGEDIKSFRAFAEKTFMTLNPKYHGRDSEMESEAFKNIVIENERIKHLLAGIGN